MLTEEKLQNFLDDLRLGKYDTDRYKVIPYSENMLAIEKLDTEIRITVSVNHDIDVQYWRDFHKWSDANWLKRFFIKKPVYDDYDKTYNGYHNDEGVTISKNLHDSFCAYCTELLEKDRMIRRINEEDAFGL